MSRRFLSFEHKLLIGIALSITVVFAVSGMITHELIRKKMVEQAERNMQLTSQSLQAAMRATVINSVKNYLKGVAETNRAFAVHLHDRVRQGALSESEAREQVSRFMLSQKIGPSGYLTALELDGDTPRLAVHPYAQGLNLSNYAFARDMVRQREGYMEFMWQNPGDAAPRLKAEWMSYFPPWRWIISAAPFRDEYPHLIDMSGIDRELAKIRMEGSGYATIISMQGELLSHPQWRGRNLMNTLNIQNGRPFIRDMIDSIRQAIAEQRPEGYAGQVEYHIREPDGEQVYWRLLHYRYIEEFDWILGVVTDLDALYEPLETVRRMILLTYVLTILLAVWLVSWRLRQGTRSIRALVTAVDRVEGGRLDPQWPVLANDEIGLLGQAFARMSSRLTEYTSRLERLVEERTASLRDSEHKYRLLVEHSLSIIYTLSPSGRFTYVSPSWSSQLGHPAHMLIGEDFRRFLVANDQPLFEAFLQRTLSTRQVQPPLTCRIIDRAGQEHWYRSVLVPVFGRDGKVLSLVGNGIDFTHEKEHEQALTRLATLDPLTGIANRRLFTEAAERELARCQRGYLSLALLMLDIDYFKQVNDLHGHAAGDMVLRQTAACCQALLREGDWLGRWGGEEFVVLLVDTDEEAALMVAERIRQALAEQQIVVKPGCALTITASIGIAMYTDDEDFEHLMARADRALYQAKAQGRNRTLFDRPSPDTGSLDRLNQSVTTSKEKEQSKSTGK